jgi:hypothetical protein
MALSLVHPSPPRKDQPDLRKSLRIGLQSNEKKPLADTPGTHGYTPEQVFTLLNEWNSDSQKYCEMDYVHPNIEEAKKSFIAISENPDNFEVLVLGKELSSPWSKAALRNIQTGNIIFRSATFDPNYTNPRGEKRNKTTKQSHNKDWVVQGRLFNADSSFWEELKKNF